MTHPEADCQGLSHATVEGDT